MSKTFVPRVTRHSKAQALGKGSRGSASLLPRPRVEVDKAANDALTTGSSRSKFMPSVVISRAAKATAAARIRERASRVMASILRRVPNKAKRAGTTGSSTASIIVMPSPLLASLSTSTPVVFVSPTPVVSDTKEVEVPQVSDDRTSEEMTRLWILHQLMDANEEVNDAKVEAAMAALTDTATEHSISDNDADSDVSNVKVEAAITALMDNNIEDSDPITSTDLDINAAMVEAAMTPLKYNIIEDSDSAIGIDSEVGDAKVETAVAAPIDHTIEDSDSGNSTDSNTNDVKIEAAVAALTDNTMEDLDSGNGTDSEVSVATVEPAMAAVMENTMESSNHGKDTDLDGRSDRGMDGNHLLKNLAVSPLYGHHDISEIADQETGSDKGELMPEPLCLTSCPSNSPTVPCTSAAESKHPDEEHTTDEMTRLWMSHEMMSQHGYVDDTEINAAMYEFVNGFSGDSCSERHFATEEDLGDKSDIESDEEDDFLGIVPLRQLDYSAVPSAGALRTRPADQDQSQRIVKKVQFDTSYWQVTVTNWYADLWKPFYETMDDLDHGDDDEDSEEDEIGETAHEANLDVRDANQDEVAVGLLENEFMTAEGTTENETITEAPIDNETRDTEQTRVTTTAPEIIFSDQQEGECLVSDVSDWRQKWAELMATTFDDDEEGWEPGQTVDWSA